MKRFHIFLVLIVLSIFIEVHSSPVVGLKINKIESIKKVVDHGKLFNYYIEIELKNLSKRPIFYWSYTCAWSLNFFFEECDIYFDGLCTSNASVIELLLPKMVRHYNGVISSSTKINNIENFRMRFLYFDALKVSQRSFILYSLKCKILNKVQPVLIKNEIDKTWKLW